MQRKLVRRGAVLVCNGTRIDLRNFEKLRVVAIGKGGACDGGRASDGPDAFVRLEGVVAAPTSSAEATGRDEIFRCRASDTKCRELEAAEAILALLKKVR